MNTLTYRFTLDTHKNGIQRILQGFQTGEHVIREMEISIKEATEPYIFPLSNLTAVMYVLKPGQSTPSVNSCTIDAERNLVKYTILDSDIETAGVVEMQLKVINTIDGEERVLVSPKFGMEVWESNVEDEAAEQTTTYTSLTEALAAATKVSQSAIVDLYIDENNIFTVVFGDGTVYTSDAVADAIGRIDSVEIHALKSEGYAIGKQNEVDVSSSSPYYHNNSKYYAEQASASAEEAVTSASNALISETNASESATSASASASNAYTSESNAETYKNNAYSYMNTANTSASNASASETNAESYKNSALSSKNSAETDALKAEGYSSGTQNGQDVSSSSPYYHNNADYFADQASASAEEAASYELGAETHADYSQSYAVGGTGIRTGEDYDNAKYYMQRCMEISAGLAGGGIVPLGTIPFEDLPATNLFVGAMYNISNAFTSDSRFKDGGGISYGAGNNVYYTADDKWDCYAGQASVKVNNKTGANITLDGSDINVTGYSKANSKQNIAATDTVNSALGKLEKREDLIENEISSLDAENVKSVNGLTPNTSGAVTMNMGDINDVDISSVSNKDMLKYNSTTEKWENVYAPDVINNLNSTSANDSLSANQGKILKEMIANLSTEDTYLIETTDWASNTDTTTNTRFPYVATVTTTDYLGNAPFVWHMNGSGTLPTQTEQDNIDLIEECVISSTDIKLYATDEPEVDLTLAIVGGKNSFN